MRAARAIRANSSLTDAMAISKSCKKGVEVGNCLQRIAPSPSRHGRPCLDIIGRGDQALTFRFSSKTHGERIGAPLVQHHCDDSR